MGEKGVVVSVQQDPRSNGAQLLFCGRPCIGEAGATASVQHDANSGGAQLLCGRSCIGEEGGTASVQHDPQRDGFTTGSGKTNAGLGEALRAGAGSIEGCYGKVTVISADPSGP